MNDAKQMVQPSSHKQRGSLCSSQLDLAYEVNFQLLMMT
jgi:hypothetical protein